MNKDRNREANRNKRYMTIELVPVKGLFDRDISTRGIERIGEVLVFEE